MLTKPQTPTDLLPPFTMIGEPGWAQRLRQVFAAYDLPLPPPVPTSAITQREYELGVTFPQSLHTFLTTFGAVNFDGVHLIEPASITDLSSVWFRAFLSADEQSRLSELYQIAQAGSDNYYALSIHDGRCWYCAHDPATLSPELASFDDLIRCAVIDLSWSYYGWPDIAIEQMAVQLKSELFGW